MLETLTLYQVDAFAQRPFEGNPAAVVPLNTWLPDHVMQAIAEENNLAETAFFVPTETGYAIRWFTPTCEVELCGHATLAAAHVLFQEMGYQASQVQFDSLSGKLSVSAEGNLLKLDFPAQPPTSCDLPTALVAGIGVQPTACLASEDYIAVLPDQSAVENVQPDYVELQKLDKRGVIITALGDGHDFVARFFAPNFGIPEDSVTGSAYTQLIPYWSNVLNKQTLRARQLSKRGGDVFCELSEDRVIIAGHAVTYLEGKIRFNMV